MKPNHTALATLMALLVTGPATGQAASPAAQSYEIVLQSRRFVPQPGATLEQPRRDRQAWQGLIQFERPLEQVHLAALRALGVKPRHFVTSNTLAATIPAGIDPRTLAGVRWAGAVEARDKVARNVSRLATVEFHPDTAEAEMARVLAGAPAERRPHRSLPRHVVHVLLPEDPAAMLALAEEETVVWISSAPKAVIEGRPVHYCAGARTIAGPVAPYVQAGQGWDGAGLGSMDLTYYFGIATPQLSLTTQRNEILRALNTWSRYAAIRWSAAAGPGRARSFDIHFAEGAEPFDGPSGTLAYCYFPSPPNPEPIAGNMYFDPAEDWNVGDDIDLFTVALHEAGHGLGLAHSLNSDAVMAPFYAGPVTGLHADDIAGIRSLYATAGSTPPPSPVPNDLFANARLLSGPAGSVTGSNVGATRESGEPYHWSDTGGQSVWYRWTAPANGLWRFETAGSDFDTLLAVYTGRSVTSLSRIVANDDTVDIDTQSRVEFEADAGQTYAIAVDGYDTAAGAIVLRWATSDNVAPTVSILAPASNARLLQPTVTLAGVASDDHAVVRVEYQLNSGSWQSTAGTTSWSTRLTLAPGLNTVRVRSLDLAGNASPVVLRTFTRIPSALLTVRTSGAGAVNPSLDGQWIELGKTCALTATPTAGSLFSHWSGSVAASSPRLSFVVRGDMTLEANFVPDPFPSVMGSYSGLFQAGEEPAPETSGSLSAQIDRRGVYSASLLWRGRRIGWSGKFALDGRATNVVVLANLPARVELALDFGTPGRLTGSLGLGSEIAELSAHRAAFDARANPCPWAGRYTVAFAGHTNDTVYPGGHSAAMVLVDTAGRLRLTGTLGDGTPVTHGARLSSEGYWPLHLPLYQGRGSFLGWMEFEQQRQSDVAGRIHWSKPPLASAGRPYPAGFQFTTAGAGARYLAPTLGTTLLSMTNGVVTLSGSTLAADMACPILLGADNHVLNLGSTPLSLSFTPRTGAFRGRATEPSTGRVLTFTGVALQAADLAAGSFRNGPATGAVIVSPSGR